MQTIKRDIITEYRNLFTHIKHKRTYFLIFLLVVSSHAEILNFESFEIAIYFFLLALKNDSTQQFYRNNVWLLQIIPRPQWPQFVLDQLNK